MVAACTAGCRCWAVGPQLLLPLLFLLLWLLLLLT
jgi:hypothetical protein